MKTLNEILANLKEEQKQLLADTINHGSWGDCDAFIDGKNVWANGYITDLAYKGNHFERKTLSNMFKELFKALGLKGNSKEKQSDCMCWIYDWWEDGTGSILLIPEQLATELEEWAKNYTEKKEKEIERTISKELAYKCGEALVYEYNSHYDTRVFSVRVMCFRALYFQLRQLGCEFLIASAKGDSKERELGFK